MSFTPPSNEGPRGGRLLAPVLARADDAVVPRYLETPFPEIHAFYRGLGFEVTSEVRPFEAPTPVWTMTRLPAPNRTKTALDLGPHADD
jgi:hypothetical protein